MSTAKSHDKAKNKIYPGSAEEGHSAFAKKYPNSIILDVDTVATQTPSIQCSLSKSTNSHEMLKAKALSIEMECI